MSALLARAAVPATVLLAALSAFLLTACGA